MGAFNNIGYVKWLWQNRTPLIVVQVIAVIAAVIISSPTFMPPQYKSYAVVYPYNFSVYSHETPTEQMLEFLTSTDIKDSIIKKFDLIKHYDIDTTDKAWKARLLEKYDKNVTVSSTEYEAVDITVYDTSPELAYRIVNGILDALNHKVLGVQREKSLETARIWKRQLDLKKKECDSLSNLSKSLSVQYGLLDYSNQTREVVRAYYEGKGSHKDVQDEMRNMEEEGSQLQAVRQHLEAALTDYDNILVQYEASMKDVNKQLTFSNLVTSPYPADKKTYPIRWLVVLIVCAASFLFSAVILRTIERLKQ